MKTLGRRCGSLTAVQSRRQARWSRNKTQLKSTCDPLSICDVEGPAWRPDPGDIPMKTATKFQTWNPKKLAIGKNRRGAIAVLIAVLMIIFLMAVAFSVDV